MQASGWLITLALMIGAFLPALGARSARSGRVLAVFGAIVATVIGGLAAWTALSAPSQVFFIPNTAGFMFLLIALPLGASVCAAGLVLLLTRRSRLSERTRAILAGLAFLLPASVSVWFWFTPGAGL